MDLKHFLTEKGIDSTQLMELIQSELDNKGIDIQLKILREILNFSDEEILYGIMDEYEVEQECIFDDSGNFVAHEFRNEDDDYFFREYEE